MVMLPALAIACLKVRWLGERYGAGTLAQE